MLPPYATHLNYCSATGNNQAERERDHQSIAHGAAASHPPIMTAKHSVWLLSKESGTEGARCMHQDHFRHDSRRVTHLGCHPDEAGLVQQMSASGIAGFLLRDCANDIKLHWLSAHITFTLVDKRAIK